MHSKIKLKNLSERGKKIYSMLSAKYGDIFKWVCTGKTEEINKIDFADEIDKYIKRNYDNY